MGLIPHRYTVSELGWGLNPHPNSKLLPSSFFLRFNKVISQKEDLEAKVEELQGSIKK